MTSFLAIGALAPVNVKYQDYDAEEKKWKPSGAAPSSTAPATIPFLEPVERRAPVEHDSARIPVAYNMRRIMFTAPHSAQLLLKTGPKTLRVTDLTLKGKNDPVVTMLPPNEQTGVWVEAGHRVTIEEMPA